MAVRQYIGARYVPRFTGLYDNTQSYEALDVVDNGSDTSYIAKKPTPAGTPLTNTDYWFLYGSTNGAIVNLQNQIDDMKDGTVPGSLQEQINTNTSDITALTNATNDLEDRLDNFGYANVKDYGAIGDGVTDDTQAFIDALNNATGVYVPTGTYLITQTLDLAKKNRVFIGDGGSNSILIDGITSNNHTFIKVDNGEMSDPHFLTDLDIGRLGIIGNDKCSVAFHVHGTAHSLYHDIIATNLDKTDAIAFKIASQVCAFKNLKTAFMDGDAYYGHEGDYGVYFDLYDRGDLGTAAPVNNNFYDCYFTGNGKYGIYIRYGGENRFYSCVAESNTVNNLYIEDVSGVNKTDMNSFIGCGFEDAPICVMDKGKHSVYVDTYFNSYDYTDDSTDRSFWVYGSDIKFFGCSFRQTPMMFGYGSSCTLFNCHLAKQYQSSGGRRVISYNSRYDDGSLVTFEDGYFTLGTLSNGVFSTTNSHYDILVINIVGHNVATEAATITSNGQTSTAFGNTFILYPGDSISINTSSASVIGKARHMSIN